MNRWALKACVWCNRHVIGNGHQAHGMTFCSWVHWLMWHVERQRGRGDHDSHS